MHLQLPTCHPFERIVDHAMRFKKNKYFSPLLKNFWRSFRRIFQNRKKRTRPISFDEKQNSDSAVFSLELYNYNTTSHY